MSESSALIERLGLAATIAGGQAAHDPHPVGAWRDEGLARGKLHELFAAEPGDAGAGAGFALALALAAGALPLLWLRTEEAERRGGRLSGGGAVELGFDPAALLLGLVSDEAALLRAAADAGRCAGLGMVLVEAWGRMPRLDLTATRRLMLAAEGSGATILVLRVEAAPTPSAAATRWSVAAAPSAALDADAPGAPAFDVECLRRRGGPSGQRWRVEWNRETQNFVPQDHAAAPLSGAGVPVAVDRTAALDPPAPLRRAG